MSEDVALIRQDQKKILDLVEEVRQLRKENKDKDRKIADLERRVDDLEQYSRINDVIVTGLRIKPRSYANAVAADNNGGVPSEEETLSTERQVASFLGANGIFLEVNDLEACHPLPRRGNEAKPAVILRFANRKKKIALMKLRSKLKGTDVYLNDHLTRRNAEIAKRARHLRRLKKIQSTWVSNCRIFVLPNGSPDEAKVIVIRDLSELDRFEGTAAGSGTPDV